tara:strand:- start:22 stop:1089 length:1068 start_codon:yes stop_codon:yes gene_type:complete
VALTRVRVGMMQDISHSDVGNNKHPTIVYPPTNTVFSKCTQIHDLTSYWKYSGKVGNRSDAPTTVANDTVIGNFDVDMSSWYQSVNVTDDGFVDATETGDNFYWYVSRLVYLEAGLFSFEGDKDDDHVWYFVPPTGTPIQAGGDITDTDGQNAGAYNSNNISVTTSGFYRWVGRAIDGGGGAKLRLLRVTQGLDRIWTPVNEHPAETVIDSSTHQRTDVITTTSQSGVEALVTPSIRSKTLTSKFKMNAIVSGQGGDDTRTEFQYSVDNGSNYTSLSFMGDHSWTHRSNQGAISLGYNYEFQPYAAVDSLVKVRAVIKAENSTSGGFFLNSGVDPQPGGFNKDSSTSTIQLQEIV